MSILGSDGLSLFVGDGAAEENFSTLRGVTVTQLEITQKLTDNPAIATDAWSIGFGVTDRRAVIECDALATDEAAAARVRALALSGDAGNFRLASSASQTLSFQAFITQYQETIQPGAIKRFTCRLESSASIALG